MTPHDARDLCAKHGSVLRHYEPGRVASIIIPSGEVLTVSVGTATAKIFCKRALFGWLLPKRIGDKNLADWIPEYSRLSRLQMSVARAMVLDGLINLAAQARCAGELSFAWTVLRNPIEVAVEDCGWGLMQEQARPTAEERSQSKAQELATWFNKGKALIELGGSEQAIPWFDKALAIDPRLANAWFGKGEALFRLGRLDDAKTCLGKAIEIDPQCAADWASDVINEAQKKRTDIEG